MYLKSGLGWLEGFPLGQNEGCVSWMAMPQPGDPSTNRIDLTRTHLREATQTWTRLVRGFPRALPRLVDEPDRWTEGVPQILEWLKGAIHDGKSLPESLLAVERAYPRGIAEHAAAIATRWPSLRPLLNALSCSSYLTPDVLSAALPWIESNARAIRTILDAQPGNDALLIVLGLCELARRDGHRGVSAILLFAGDPRACTVATRAEWYPTIEHRLTEHPDDPRLSGRLRNLRFRLESVQAISPARLGRLKSKLERAVRRNLVVVLQARLEVALDARLKQLLEVDAIPDWMFEPQPLRVLAPMLRLSRAFRMLGLRLFRRRLGPPPWNLAEDPANQALLARLDKRGVNLDPWLNPLPPCTWTGSNGRNVVLAFEPDPLEIFQMGWHFSTCLSPGDSNFFSVFANAADVNKQVVHARDEQGGVVGRCLLALTEDGNLLMFEPYCHDPDLERDTMVGQLATTLALRMNRVLVPRGKVPCLVAPDWYDDGPLDPCGRFEFLNDGSSFRQSLPDIDCDSLVARLEEQFDPLPLNSLTLSLALEISELEERPELIRPLLPLLETCKSLPDRALTRAAYLAHLAGAPGFAHRVLRDVGVRYVLRAHRQYHSLEREAMTALVELEPAAALRVLRKTRPLGVGSDNDEVCPERRRHLARAYARLGREAWADRLNGP